jgi:hypothetical protein
MENIKEYIKRAIPDIARKCNTKVDEVIKEIKNLYEN